MSKDVNDKQTIDAFSPLMDPQQVKALIKEKGWNQKQVAEYWDISKDWVSRLILNKNGERNRMHDCAFMGLPKK